MTTLKKDWSSLPFEIISLILAKIMETKHSYSAVVPSEIGQCALTCQSWKLAAQTLLFSNIRITTQADINTMLINLTSRHLVKSLVYNCSTNNLVFDQLNLTILAHAFTHLETITCRDPNISIYYALHSLLTKGELQYLKSIPIPNHEIQTELYLKCILALKNRLDDLTVSIFDSGLSSDPDFGPLVYHQLHDKLDQFSRLTKISIANTYSGINNVKDFVESTLSNTNVRLDSITLYLKYSITTTTTTTTTTTNAVHSQSTKNEVIEPFPHIKSLTLLCDQLRTVDEKSIKYIMKKFPKLNKFRWIEGVFVTRDYIVKPSISTCVQFINYLCNIPDRSFQSLATDSNTCDILYQVFSAPSNYKKNCLKINLQDYGDAFNESNPITWIELTSYGKQPLYRQRSIDVFSKMTRREDGSTRYNILKKVGRYLDELALDSDYRYLDDPDYAARTPYASLSCVAESCVNLEKLYLCSMEDGFFDLSRRQGTHGLKKLILNGDEFSDKNMFPSIASNFPLLEYLHLDHRTFEEDISISDHIVMTMSGLSLKTIQISSRRNSLNDKIGFQLVTGNQQQIYFKLLLIPGASQRFFSGNTYGGHQLVKIGSHEFEESVESSDYVTFFITCQSVEEIELDYYTDADFSHVVVNCLSELSKN